MKLNPLFDPESAAIRESLDSLQEQEEFPKWIHSLDFFVTFCVKTKSLSGVLKLLRSMSFF